MLLRITEQGFEPRELSIDGAIVVVGRSAKCDVVLSARTVSGQHLRLLDRMVVEDLGSRNGTFVDGRPIVRPELCVGKRIAIGGPGSLLEVSYEPESPLAILQAELERLRRMVGEGDDGTRTAKGEAPIGMRVIAPSNDPNEILLGELIAHDAATYPTKLNGSVIEYYMLESFRFIRNVETIVTRLAGALTANAGELTVLPGDSDRRNLRAILDDLLLTPDSQDLREELVNYHTRLLQWFYASYDTYRAASVGLVKEVREALRPQALRRHGPIPWLYRATKLEDLIFWRRVQDHLDELSHNYVNDRLESIARESAKDLVDNEGDPNWT